MKRKNIAILSASLVLVAGMTLGHAKQKKDKMKELLETVYIPGSQRDVAKQEARQVALRDTVAALNTMLAEYRIQNPKCDDMNYIQSLVDKFMQDFDKKKQANENAYIKELKRVAGKFYTQTYSVRHGNVLETFAPRTVEDFWYIINDNAAKVSDDDMQKLNKMKKIADFYEEHTTTEAQRYMTDRNFTIVSDRNDVVYGIEDNQWDTEPNTEQDRIARLLGYAIEDVQGNAAKIGFVAVDAKIVAELSAALDAMTGANRIEREKHTREHRAAIDMAEAKHQLETMTRANEMYRTIFDGRRTLKYVKQRSK